jgi:hypothetical protein
VKEARWKLGVFGCRSELARPSGYSLCAIFWPKKGGAFLEIGVGLEGEVDGLAREVGDIVERDGGN